MSSTTAFTIQPITNEAPGGLGNAYRLEPSGQTFAAPVQISFRYEQEASGTFAGVAGVAYQDFQHFWRALKSASLDQTNKTLTVSSTHLSDWSYLEGFSLIPFKPQVPVGNSLGLTLAFCSMIDYGDDLTALASTCVAETGDVRASAWAVNGLAGGNSTTGTVVQSGDYGATFTAPARKPTPSLVAVSATLGRGSDRYQVVSNVSIIDDSWIGTADGGVGPAFAAVQVTWTLQGTVNNVSTYRPSGTAHYSFDGCTVTPADGELDATGFLTIDYNANPPTYDGIGDGNWMAVFNCPPSDPFHSLVTFLYFDGTGVVGPDGKTIEGSGQSRDGVWDMHWQFFRHAPGSQ